MGMIIGPGMLFHLGIFLIGLSINGYNTNGLLNKIKYIPFSLLITAISSYIFVYETISSYQNSNIYAFKILFDIVYGKYLICLILLSALMFCFVKLYNKQAIKIILSSIFMFPFSSLLVSGFLFEDYKKVFNIVIHY